MPTAIECLEDATCGGEAFQRPINAFIDAFRRAPPDEREAMVATPIRERGRLQGLIAGVVSALCRETTTPTPGWVGLIGSDEPFFPFPAASFEMRLRLMIESPVAFRIRNVFVPESYLSRA